MVDGKLAKLEAAQAQIQGTLRGLVEQMGTLKATVERDGKQSAEETKKARDRMRSEILEAVATATKQAEKSAEPVYLVGFALPYFIISSLGGPYP